jgi:hypothetical protein
MRQFVMKCSRKLEHPEKTYTVSRESPSHPHHCGKSIAFQPGGPWGFKTPGFTCFALAPLNKLTIYLNTRPIDRRQVPLHDTIDRLLFCVNTSRPTRVLHHSVHGGIIEKEHAPHFKCIIIVSAICTTIPTTIYRA